MGIRRSIIGSNTIFGLEWLPDRPVAAPEVFVSAPRRRVTKKEVAVKQEIKQEPEVNREVEEEPQEPSPTASTPPGSIPGEYPCIEYPQTMTTLPKRH